MKPNRRTFVQTLGIGALGAAMPPVAAAQQAKAAPTAAANGPILQVGDKIAVADTTYGKVRGYILRGVHYFLGIPYGADTAGAEPLHAAAEAEALDGRVPGALLRAGRRRRTWRTATRNQFGAFRDHWNYGDASEDCLRINVFTPALKDGKKRPVMFWIHGGGFTAGNGIEHDGYNGENLARFGDVVFCSINHRLGSVGFCNLAGVGGEKFAASGNVGMLDIVAALEWVRDNIANFGGDPDNVTIMGQSGGGAKVCMLTAMPSAKGLIHRAVVLSGATVRSGDKEFSEKLGSYVLKEAGLSAAEIGKLQEMPWKQFYAIAQKAQQKLSAEAAAPAAACGPASARGRWRGSCRSTRIPGGGAYRGQRADDHLLGVERAGARLAGRLADDHHAARGGRALKQRAGFGAGFGDKAIEVVQSYAKAFPDKKPVDIWSMVSSNRQASSRWPMPR